MVLKLEVNVIGEKLEKNLQFFFLNLEESRAVQNQIRNILMDTIEVNNQKDINSELYVIKISLVRDNTYQNMT